jgi:RNA polymerase sigma factor (sigma-70 family)
LSGVGISTLGSAPSSVANARELLAEFKASGDQHAFEEIVRRYAGMVFGVCLRTTKNTHDAEDATQAVFLSLAAQCKTTDGVRYVGPWLQQVAKRVSLDIKRSRKRRENREHRHHQLNGNGNGHTEVEKGGAVDVDELKGVLGEELSQLPAKYRLPLILHYFGGLTRDEMARELNCKPATLGVRIHRGREMLGRRLHERGAAPEGLVLSSLLAGSIQGGVSDALVARTCEAVAKLATGQDLGSMISAHVMAYSKTAAAGAALAVKLKAIAAIVLVACLTAGATGAAVKLAPIDLKFRNPFNFNWLPTFRSPLPSPRLDGPRTSAPVARNEPNDVSPGADAPPPVRVAQAPSATPARNEANQPGVPTPPAGSSGPLQLVAADPAASPSVPAASDAIVEQALPGTSAEQAVHVDAWMRLDSLALAGIAGPLASAFAGGQFVVDGDVNVGTTGVVDSILPGGGVTRMPGATVLSVGSAAGSVGQFTLNGGNLDFDVVDVGRAGHGVFEQNGGVNTVTQLALGSGPTGVGEYYLRAGRLDVRRGPGGAAGVMIGGKGHGRMRIGDADGSTGIIQDVGGDVGEAPSLVVRADPGGSGTIEGAGVVNLPGKLLLNGAAIADGHGQGRTLDFYGFAEVVNSIENPTVGGRHGWFAKAGGRLTLPPMKVRAGTATYTFGESEDDAVLDLVNSARLTLHDAPADGSLEVSLLAVDRGGVPPLPRGHTFIGIWQVDLVALANDPATGLSSSDPMEPGGIDLSVRYDDALAAQLGLDESALKLWKYSDGKWTRILEGFERHPELNILNGRVDGGLDYFAVSAPEPAAGALLLLGAGYLLARRPRRQD